MRQEPVAAGRIALDWFWASYREDRLIRIKPFDIAWWSCLWFAFGVTLTACGGGGDSGTPPPASTYTIGGSVSGLIAGTSVVLQDNGGNNTPVSVNASFTFSTGLVSGASYAVTVLTQPDGEKCAVTNGSGTVASADVAVAVACVPNSYTVGGTVSGLLTGASVALLDNGGNNTTVAANGGFAFSTPVKSGSAYAVTVATQPAGEKCTVSSGSGTVAGANVSNVGVICSPVGYTVTASVFGLLANSNLVLQDNNGDNLTVTVGGTFNFKTPVASQSPYSVTVLTQPSGQTCVVQNGSGMIAATNVTITVVCPWHIAYIPDYFNSTLYAYYIDPTTGNLMLAAQTSSSSFQQMMGAAVTPNGQFVYVANSGPNILGYSFNPSTGMLAPLDGSPYAFAGQSASQSIAIDPTGQFLYSGNNGYSCGTTCTVPNGISAFTIDPTTGALTQITGSQLTSIPASVPAVIAPGGQYLLTPGAEYSINTVTGALSAIPGYTGTGGSDSPNRGQFWTYIAADPSGDFVYADYMLPTGGTVPYTAAISIDPTTGVTTSLPASQFATPDIAPLVVSPNGQFLYVGNNNGIAVFSIDAVTGAQNLLPNGGFPFPQDSTFYPTAIAVDPSGRFLYASSQGDSGIYGFSINVATGALTLIPGFPMFTGKVVGAFSQDGGYSIAISAIP